MQGSIGAGEHQKRSTRSLGQGSLYYKGSATFPQRVQYGLHRGFNGRSQGRNERFEIRVVWNFSTVADEAAVTAL